jgi:hypothetical protein
MITLFDIMRNAQGSGGIDLFARQAGLGAEQAQRAMEALLPAFSLGLQRSAANPAAFGALLGLMGAPGTRSFFDNPSQAFTPQGMANGNDVLRYLFGSSEASHQVAQQVAMSTGLGAQVVQQMLAPMAAVLLGGLAKSASEQGLAGLVSQWAAALHRLQMQGTAPAAAASVPNPYAAWAELMASMMGTKPPQPQRQEGPFNPYEFWADMMGRMVGRPAAAPPQPDPSSPFGMLLQMFQTGREMQGKYLDEIETILRRAWTPPAS